MKWIDQLRIVRSWRESTTKPIEISMLGADRRHLQWIFDRMVNIHGENPLYDYMHRLKEIIDREPVGVSESEVGALTQRIDDLLADNDRMRGEVFALNVALRVMAERIEELEGEQ